VGAKFEIYNIINKLTEEGVSFIMISSELPELLGMCDRFIILCNGKITAELEAEEATEDNVMAAATGVNR
jgi:ABC-type sugar transport system ATPase subunit